MTERPRVTPAAPPAGTGTDRVLFIGTATTLIQAAGFTILTDPNFLHRGQRAYVGMGLTTRRLTEPALSAGELPPLDFVVLSHHHGDHFDRIAARDLDHGLPIVTEPHAARKLRRQGFRSPVALSTWQSHVVARDDAEVRGDVPARPARAPAARLRRAAGDGQPARLLPRRAAAAAPVCHRRHPHARRDQGPFRVVSSIGAPGRAWTVSTR